MAIQLNKGQRIDLTKGTNLTKVRIGLGWQTQQYHGSHDFDLDASAFVVNENGRVFPDSNFVFYNNPNSATNAVVHTGDQRTGGTADSIEEELIVDFAKLAADTDKIAVTVTIHEAEYRNQNFGQVDNAFVLLTDEETGEEILRFDLTEDFATQTAITFCELYKHNGDWKFNAVGAGFDGGLADLCRHYGLDVG